MKATVLVDNLENNGIPGEWGLSFFIEYNGVRLLLDTGASTLFADNASRLKLPLEKVDFAVLSHAHFDHGNGMARFFELNRNASFYLRDGCGENCYKKKWLFSKYIGLPKGILEQYKDRITYASGCYKICQGIHLVPHKAPGLDAIGKREHMYQRINGKWRPDGFSHEQSLVFETQKGLVVFNSCSHGGVLNIVNEVLAAFPGQQVIAFIGGFHIYNKPADEVAKLACSIKDLGIEYVCTGHCTGKKAYEILKAELGDTLHQLKSGLVMRF